MKTSVRSSDIATTLIKSSSRIASYLLDMERVTQLQTLADKLGTLVMDCVRGHKLTASLVAANIGLISWYVYWKTSRRRRLIDQIPGIKDYPLVGDLLHMPADPYDFYNQMSDWVEERLGGHLMKMKIGETPSVLLFSAEAVETLLSSTELLDKTRNYRYLHSFIGLGILNSTGDQWRQKRKMLTPTFHFNILKDFLELMNECSQNLMEKLRREACDSGKEYDIFLDMTLSSLDIICTTAMGVHIDALNNDDSDYVKAVYDIKDSIGRRGREPLSWYDFTFNRLPRGREINKLIALTHQFTHKVIRERRESIAAGDYKSGKYRPLLDTLLQYRNEKTGESLSDEEIRAEVDTFMFEGHDTTSSALGFTAFMFGKYVDIQRRCQKELDDIMGGRHEVTTDDLAKMTYLEWCIKETLRIFPSVPIFGRNLTKDTVIGYTVPKDVSVSVLTWCLHSDPKVFPDPEKFDPLRFTPDNCVNRHPYAYVPFSAGPRNCIGQKFAMMELKVILGSLLLNFNIESTQERKELRPNPGLILQPTQGIKVKLTSRG